MLPRWSGWALKSSFYLDFSDEAKIVPIGLRPGRGEYIFHPKWDKAYNSRSG